MKIYKVSRTDRIGYDQYDAFICIAETAEDARRMHPNDDEETYDDGDDDKPYFNNWVYRKDVGALLVEEIGTTDDNSQKVVLASYNAG